MPPRLQHDHRLCPGRVAQGRDEGWRVVNAFDVKQDRRGVRVGRQEMQHVAEIHVERIAQRHQRREAKVMGRGPVGDGRDQCTGLRDQRQPSRRRLGAQEGGVELQPRPHQPHAVRPEIAHPGLARRSLQLPGVVLSGRATLAEPRRQDDRVGGAGNAALPDDLGHHRRRRGDHRKVDRLVEPRQVGHAIHAVYALVFRVHRVKLALVARPQDVGEDAPADGRGAFRGPEHGDGGRVEHRAERAAIHRAVSGQGRVRPIEPHGFDNRATGRTRGPAIAPKTARCLDLYQAGSVSHEKPGGPRLPPV